MRLVTIPVALVLVCAAVVTASEQQPPYGAKDFYPSDDRPIGWNGDGTGFYPGATPVSKFSDGTVSPIKRTIMRRGKEMILDSFELTDDKSVNIAWKTRMPAWSNSEPIVVGDRIFTLAEPYSLVCCDAHSGKILWTVVADPWSSNGVDEATAAKLVAMHEVYFGWPWFKAMFTKSTVYRPLVADEWKKFLPIYKDKAMPSLLQALKEIDPGTDYASVAQKEYDIIKTKVADRLIAGHQFKSNDRIGVPRKGWSMLEFLQERMRTIAGGDFPHNQPRLRLPWAFEVGTMNAPVSDGRYVYASFGYGSTVCCDLNGQVIWKRFFPNGISVPTQAPVLIGDTLVGVHNHIKELVGINKHTGEVLWSAPAKAAGYPKSFRQKNAYVVGGHAALTLTKGDLRVPVVVSLQGNLIRASDGKILGEIAYQSNTFNPQSGITPMFHGNVVLNRGEKGTLSAYELALVDADTIQVTKRFDSEVKVTYNQHVLSDKGMIVSDKKSMVIVDLKTGEVVSQSKNMANLSDMLAGTVYFSAQSGHAGHQSQALQEWKFRRAGDKAYALFHTTDLTNPSNPKPIAQNNLLGGADFPSVPGIEKHAPALYAEPWYASSAWGKPAHVLHTNNSITALGNRVFIRSMSHLYAIGDPKVPYNWNPKSRPADIPVD